MHRNESAKCAISSKTERLKHSTTFVVSETPRLPAGFFSTLLELRRKIAAANGED